MSLHTKYSKYVKKREIGINLMLNLGDPTYQIKKILNIHIKNKFVST